MPAAGDGKSDAAAPLAEKVARGTGMEGAKWKWATIMLVPVVLAILLWTWMSSLGSAMGLQNFGRKGVAPFWSGEQSTGHAFWSRGAVVASSEHDDVRRQVAIEEEELPVVVTERSEEGG
ncbi:hypothetical protein MRB53_038604 [Persea americana]|nr:hypothetical protein MRB53_038604 [Persea americana]